MSHWAIDLGTTNSALARWDAERQRADLLELPGIIREDVAGGPIEAPTVVPSATHVVEEADFWTTVGRFKLFQQQYWGRHAYIGQEALERNVSTIHPNFVTSFKPYLQSAALQPIARLGDRDVTAREVCRSFLRELFAAVYRHTGERIRELVVTCPVDAYEAYRAEVRGILQSLGVKKVHFVDEPVAAAAGYGLSVREPRNVLVVDFGGGTLDIAWVRMDARKMGEGSCEVVAKAGRPIGGNVVDGWLLEHFLHQTGSRMPVEQDQFWKRLLLQEARWVKESLFLKPAETFFLKPPDHLRSAAALAKTRDTFLEVTKEALSELLVERGMYRQLESCTDEVLAQAREQGFGDTPDDVLMVGGSTLLPGVFPMFEDRFGRDRVRAWQPFEAVVYGATSLSAADFTPQDFIVHDYAIVVHDPVSREKGHAIVIPAGTRFPTKYDFWKRQLVPTCAMGMPERLFKLVIAEIGQAPKGDRSFGWDAEGQLHQLETDGDRLVVTLNESNPTLGTLDPPQSPSDRTPRLEVSFGVDGDRWLIGTVLDLKTGKTLMDREPVVRLL